MFKTKYYPTIEYYPRLDKLALITVHYQNFASNIDLIEYFLCMHF